MNRSLFLTSKVIFSNGNLSILSYLVSRNIYLKSKFILSTFRSPLLSNYSSVTKKKVHCIIKICSVSAVEWNWQLRVFLFWLRSKKKKELYRLKMILSLKGKLLVINFIVVMVIKLMWISWKISVTFHWVKKPKETLAKMQLRKNSKTDDPALRTIITSELETPLQCLEYRGIKLCKFFKKKTQKE